MGTANHETSESNVSSYNTIKRQPLRTIKYSTRMTLSFAAIAVAASLAAVTLIPKYHADNLTDTFDDPYLAYAQVEATFQKIADKMAAGVDLAARAGETAEKTVEIIQKVTE